MENQIAILCLALGLLAVLYLLLQIKMEVRRSETRWRKEIEQVRFQLNDQSSKWIQTARRQEALPAPKVPLRAEVAFPLRASAPSTATTLWDGNTKAKAIEMVRQGESSSKISAALSHPKPDEEFPRSSKRPPLKVNWIRPRGWLWLRPTARRTCFGWPGFFAEAPYQAARPQK